MLQISKYSFNFQEKVHLMGSALGGFLAQKFAEYTRPCPRVASLILCNTFTDTSIFRFTESAPMWVTRLLEICLVTPSEIVVTCHLFSIRNGFRTYEMQLCIKSFECTLFANPKTMHNFLTVFHWIFCRFWLMPATVLRSIITAGLETDRMDLSIGQSVDFMEEKLSSLDKVNFFKVCLYHFERC